MKLLQSCVLLLYDLHEEIRRNLGAISGVCEDDDKHQSQTSQRLSP
jgi:hypothetical protein